MYNNSKKNVEITETTPDKKKNEGEYFFYFENNFFFSYKFNAWLHA